MGRPPQECAESQDKWDKTLNAVEGAMVLEKTLKQALCHGLGSVHADHLCDFLENHFLMRKRKSSRGR